MALHAWPLSSTKTLVQDKAAVDQAVTYGGLLIFMGHVTADTSADSVTFAESDLAALMDYVIAQGCDILTMRQLRDRLRSCGSLPDLTYDAYNEVRMIGRLAGANMNSTADQAITLPAGSWEIVGVYAAKGSISLTTAAGGIYTGASKGGTAVVAAGQTYAALTGTETDVQICTVGATPTVTLAAEGTGLYLSLTTGQGAVATADIFIYARPA
jgi:D-serine deaminase-like pyridoxal phosphate-dependent protein